MRGAVKNQGHLDKLSKLDTLADRWVSSLECKECSLGERQTWYLDPNLTHIYTAKPPRGAHPGHLTREKSNKWNQSDFTILSGDQFENTFDKTYSREV